jgi:iron complex transport system substrate-binding protein
MSRASASLSPPIAGWTDSELRALVAALTRRKLISGSVASGLLAGSGLNHAVAQSATPVAGSRSVETANGPIEVPAEANRVVCADYYSPFAVFDTGLIPVGAIDGLAANLLPEFIDLYQATTKIGSFGEPDLEQIVSLQPDLIVGSAEYSGAYDQLQAIAPSALFTFAGSGDWPAFAASIADAIGRKDAFDRIVHTYEQRAATIKTAHAGTLDATRWAIASGADGEWWLYYPNSSHGLVFDAAGVQFIDAVAGKTDDFTSLPYEQLNLLADADVIIIRANSDGSADEATQALLQQPLFQSLKAAQSGSVYPLSALFPFSYGMAIRLLDQIEVVAGLLQRG